MFQFWITMRKGTIFSEFTFSIHFPVAAYFCFPFCFKIVVIFFFFCFDEVYDTCGDYLRIWGMVYQTLVFIFVFWFFFCFWNIFGDFLFLRGGITLLGIFLFFSVVEGIFFLWMCLFWCPKKCSGIWLITRTFVLIWHFFVYFWKFELDYILFTR